MNWGAVRAVLRQEYYHTRASWEVMFDIFLFTLINIVLFGFIANYLVASGSGGASRQVESLVVAVVFWEALRISQYSVSVSSMWNIWSHNLSNMFIAPIRLVEYISAHIIAASIKSFAILVLAIPLAYYVFHINILHIGFGPMLFAYVNMAIFATAIGLVLVGLVFQHGTKVQALTWGVIFLLQPFCAVFFPVEVLPGFLQPLAYAFPATYFFEWIRALYENVPYSFARVLWACLYNLGFLAAAAWIFSRQVAAAKRSGQFVRNDL